MEFTRSLRGVYAGDVGLYPKSMTAPLVLVVAVASVGAAAAAPSSVRANSRRMAALSRVSWRVLVMCLCYVQRKLSMTFWGLVLKRFRLL